MSSRLGTGVVGVFGCVAALICFGQVAATEMTVAEPAGSIVPPPTTARCDNSVSLRRMELAWAGDEPSPTAPSTPVFNNKSIKDRKKKAMPPAAKSSAPASDDAASKPADPKPDRPKSRAADANAKSARAADEKTPPAKGEIPMVPAEGPPDEVWGNYFRLNKPALVAVRNVVMRLHEAKKHDQVIALIEAALIEGQSQPWMYEVLALSMEVVGRPKEEIERVLLSGVDFTAVSVPNMLYSAAYLTRFGRKERALDLYRQASMIDPTRPEAYVLGLKLARDLNDADGVQWAATGIVMRAWTKDHTALHKEAEQAALDMEQTLRKKGEFTAADKLVAAMAEARQRDLVVELTWSGAADLDLIVEEPLGTVCSFDTPRTAGGGVLVHDGFGPDQKNTYEKYVCPLGFAGDYRVKVRYVWGDVVGKRAVLKLTRYLGTPQETVETRVVELEAKDKVLRLTLKKGRLKAPVLLPLPEQTVQPRREPQGLLQKVSPDSREARRTRSTYDAAQRRKMLAGVLPAPVGFQPLITVLPEGVSLAAQAIISADRRYVRLSLSPSFTTISNVFTFSFTGGGNQNQPGGGAQNQGQPQRGN